MKASEIKVGGVYEAKVNDRLTKVRVDAIKPGYGNLKSTTMLGSRAAARAIYHVTNLITGRKTTFRSAVKFRREVTANAPSVRKPAPAPAVDRGCWDRDLVYWLRRDGWDLAEFADAGAALDAAYAAGVSAKDAAGSLARAANGTPALTQNEMAAAAPVSRAAVKAVARPAFADRPSPVPAGWTPPKPKAAAPAVQPAPVVGSPLSATLKAAAAPASVDAPHLIVEARAGTGKTTTIIEGLRAMRGLAPRVEPSAQQAAVWEQLNLSRAARSVCLVAFNKAIAAELASRVPPGCEAMTMHSMGFRAVTKALGRFEVNAYAVQDIIADLLGGDIRQLRKDKPTVLKATEDLVSLCKMNLTDLAAAGEEGEGVDAVEHNVTELSALARHYDVDCNGSRDEIFGLVPRVLEACRTPRGRINYDDMIWLPVVLNLPVQTYDLLLVDEAQDLNRCQQALAKRAGRRLVLVGDPRQAIYGFAGADAESMARMERELSGVEHFGRDYDVQGCVVLPLTVTRRCGKAIVAEARKIVPDFSAHPANPDGRVSEARLDKAAQTDYSAAVQYGDMILCRCNAPLVSECFRFLKAGRKAVIQGRDIGQGLIATVNKLLKGKPPVGFAARDLVAVLSDWWHAETTKEQAKRDPNETKIQGLQDRYECLCCFCDGAATAADVIAKISAVFTDDKTTPGIRLSSIHKAKGLEAKRVFILQLDKACVPAPWARLDWEQGQEQNLLYVAITRAIESLTYVYGKDGPPRNEERPGVDF